MALKVLKPSLNFSLIYINYMYEPWYSENHKLPEFLMVLYPKRLNDIAFIIGCVAIPCKRWNWARQVVRNDGERGETGKETATRTRRREVERRIKK